MRNTRPIQYNHYAKLFTIIFSLVFVLQNNFVFLQLQQFHMLEAGHRLHSASICFRPLFAKVLAVHLMAVQCIAIYRKVLFSTVPFRQFSAVQCSSVQCSAVQCSALQFSTVQCSGGNIL